MVPGMTALCITLSSCGPRRTETGAAAFGSDFGSCHNTFDKSGHTRFAVAAVLRDQVGDAVAALAVAPSTLEARRRCAENEVGTNAP